MRFLSYWLPSLLTSLPTHFIVGIIVTSEKMISCIKINVKGWGKVIGILVNFFVRILIRIQ